MSLFFKFLSPIFIILLLSGLLTLIELTEIKAYTSSDEPIEQFKLLLLPIKEIKTVLEEKLDYKELETKEKISKIYLSVIEESECSDYETSVCGSETPVAGEESTCCDYSPGENLSEEVCKPGEECECNDYTPELGEECGSGSSPIEGTGPTYQACCCCCCCGGICPCPCACCALCPSAYLWDSVTGICGCAG